MGGTTALCPITKGTHKWCVVRHERTIDAIIHHAVCDFCFEETEAIVKKPYESQGVIQRRA